jgi:acyl-coenzyme A thioesterase PaaI-like protein
VDTNCRARIVRQGRRVVVVAVEAYQDDVDKPVATAVVHLLVAE